LTEQIKRNKNHRHATLKLISQILSKSRVRKFLNDVEYITYNGDEIEYSTPLITLIDSLKIILEKRQENLEDDDFGLIDIIQLTISNSSEKLNNTTKKPISDLSNSLKVLFEKEKMEHPKDRFLKYLDKNRPKFIFFDNDERFLKANYSLNDLASPPASIKNLLKVGKVDIESVILAIQNNDTGERLSLLETANNNLRNEYSNSWSQAYVFPQLLFDIDSIKIQIKSGKSYNEITDRSDGLKQYISLKAFLATRDFLSQPVLLIDEAEIHLHYAAQSDLIKEFEKQNEVNSIIYTTHSAGCLPSDLGTGIRSIEPIIQDEINIGYSQIKNSIWLNEGGFSPILFAMGANVIAFTLARKAIIAEGPSETILLPRMFREAMSLDYLDFQVAPGIASISKSDAKLFEFESAKTTYLVDGDKGGKENKKKLQKGGIDANMIVDLPDKYSLEDFVKPEIIQKAINREFRKSGLKKIELDLSKIPENNRIGWFEKQCSKLDLRFPSKVRIAENITKEESDIPILDKSRIRQLKSVYSKVQKNLK